MQPTSSYPLASSNTFAQSSSESSSTNTRPVLSFSSLIPNPNTRQSSSIHAPNSNQGSSFTNSRPAFQSSNSNPGTSFANSRKPGQFTNTVTNEQSLHFNMASSSFTHVTNPVSNLVLLSTACVNVANSCGDLITLRALIDPGSQVSSPS